MFDLLLLAGNSDQIQANSAILRPYGGIISLQRFHEFWFPTPRSEWWKSLNSDIKGPDWSFYNYFPTTPVNLLVIFSGMLCVWCLFLQEMELNPGYTMWLGSFNLRRWIMSPCIGNPLRKTKQSAEKDVWYMKGDSKQSHNDGWMMSWFSNRVLSDVFLMLI